MTVSLEKMSPILEKDWDDLADLIEAPPFLRPGWIGAWRDAFGKGEPLYLVVRGDGGLAGVLPVERQAGRVSSPTNWHTPEFAPLAIVDEVTASLTRGLFTLGARSCSLGFVNADDSVVSQWELNVRSRKYRPLVRVVQSSPYVDTSVGWEAYEQTLGKKLRTELRRRRRRLDEKGKLRVEVHDGSTNLDELVGEGFRIEEAAWKGSEGTAINSDPATKQFYWSIARWGAERGWLRLAFLRLEDEGLAFDLSLEANGVHYLLKTGYQPLYRKFAPGMLMRYEMLKRAFDSKLTSYEFLGSNNPWKLEWTDQLRDLMLLQAFSPSVGGRLEWAAYAHLRPRAKKLIAAIKNRSSRRSAGQESGK